MDVLLYLETDLTISKFVNHEKKFDDSFKIMAVELSTFKGSVLEAAKKLVFKSLKYELFQPFRFRTKEIARLKIFDYMEVFYNNLLPF